MFNSTVLEVAIGLIFCFAATALFVSSINEGIASLFKLRANSLWKGIKELLNDPHFNGLALEIYNHGLVNPLGGKTDSGKKPSRLPSYIPSKDFAIALIEKYQGNQFDFNRLVANIEKIEDKQIRDMLTGFVKRSNEDITLLQQYVADWFDHAMDRVSGAYKRRAQLITFILAFMFAVAFHVDSVFLFKALWTHPSLSAAIVSPRDVANFKEINDELKKLPLGLSIIESAETKLSACEAAKKKHCEELNVFDYVAALPGLFITATAALFGAPFWFDILQRLINLRGTGIKPPTEKDREKSKSAATP